MYLGISSNQFLSFLHSDAFCLYFDATTKKVSAMNGSGRSPAKLTIDYMRSRNVTGHSIPVTDLNSVTVPGGYAGMPTYSRLMFLSGCAAAWVDTVEKFGSGKLSVGEILAPAIRMAEEGQVALLIL
jgi:gamma-glutamyltranspeptidase / glutathione hydrolase